MMSSEQRKTVTTVYNHLLSKEDRGWDGLDDLIDMLEYLSDDQLHREADVVYTEHSRGKVRCKEDHAAERCLMPLLVDASAAIIELYKETNSLHPKNRYILYYYLAMNQAGLILMDS
jgi:hypothetical protein